MRKPTFVDLFSGVGGFLLGFTKLGFVPLLSVDIDANCEQAHELNFPTVPFLCEDVRLLSNARLRSVIRNPVDVLVGGPPCQGFSTIGRRASSDVGQRNFIDPRNELFVEYIRILKYLKPKYFVMENVRGITTLEKGAFLGRVVEMFQGAGYTADYTLLNAADFGVPQIRNRVFIYGVRRGGTGLRPPSRTHDQESHAKVLGAIGDLAGKEREIANHVPLNHGPVNLERYRLIPEGGRMPETELHSAIYRRNFGNTFKRLHRNRPSLTMVPGHNAFPIHPWLDRSLTVREAARLQGFPDHVIFSGNRQQQCKLVGNAVPPPLAAAWAEQIKTLLD